ncbi:hypothetical protein OH76DRAFT_45527 [Lentinus brumalis]|uniref:Uncharacterized protein n=1 Tax=Lentinus brumalis TaxID=2498619 RepID=A0A371DY55_9APHY|nr:hypothetical protein OH76DRAFT_45527 [Polyporus brumalis]
MHGGVVSMIVVHSTYVRSRQKSAFATCKATKASMLELSPTLTLTYEGTKAHRRSPLDQGKAIPANLTRYACCGGCKRDATSARSMYKSCRRTAVLWSIHTCERTDVVVVVSSPSWGPPRHCADTCTPRGGTRTTHGILLSPWALCAPRCVAAEQLHDAPDVHVFEHWTAGTCSLAEQTHTAVTGRQRNVERRAARV